MEEKPFVPPKPSAFMVARIVEGFEWRLKRSFHLVRKTVDSFMPADLPPDQPVVAYVTHPSWWDPMLALAMAKPLFPKRSSYAPIQADMLERYGIFKKLGFFGIEKERGANEGRKFLQTAKTLLERPATVIWITPQGRMSDVRERPVRLERGLALLAKHVPNALYIPMASEYVFWEESRPEILFHIGQPYRVDTQKKASVIMQELSQAMEGAQDHLAELSIARDSSQFDTMLSGSYGVGGVYDVWRRMKGAVTGKKAEIKHSEL